MNPNPLVGLLFHWLGGLSAASFYVPYKAVRRWSWEITWITGGVFSWLLVPWTMAALQTRNLVGVLASVDPTTLGWCWGWGALWGIGGVTFGLTMRFLGLSLGMAVALGLTTVCGTLGPPVFRGTLLVLATTAAGKVTLSGIAVTLTGIVVIALAGRAKERELAQGGPANPALAEFALRKGLLIAIFSGILSGCFAWGLDAGGALRMATLAAGTRPLWQGLPVLCVVLLGGLTTNILWCAILIRRNRSLGELIGAGPEGKEMPLLRNYLLAGLGGTLWYLQFFFYTMGESQMGRFSFSSWTLHMASIILFSTLWGFALQEWRGSSRGTRRKVFAGIALLMGSTLIIGLGNYLGI